MIINGDCIEVMKTLPENSVDSIVTDPPYGLEFMGKEWDKFGAEIVEFTDKETGGLGGYTNHVRFNKGHESMVSLQQFCFKWATECLRVLKPGGYLLSFGGSRTYHRMACAIEDAGFEIRDQIMWIYGSGFPKSLNIGKQIDKIQGNEREIKEEIPDRWTGKGNVYEYSKQEERLGNVKITKGTSEFEGWGTALKPAHEPIVLARKPLSEKNVALNVLKHGTGGINIDGCRIGNEMIPCSNDIRSLQKWKEQDGRKHKELINPIPTFNQGRFPANIIFDKEAGQMLDEQSGESFSKQLLMKGGKQNTVAFGDYNEINTIRGHNDKGGASRFFYCAKASKSERNKGCEALKEKQYSHDGREKPVENAYQRNKSVSSNNHPTVKPIKLMEYLIKLITPAGGTVLDPFTGSGTTGCACTKLGFKFIGIEKETDYVKIAEARIEEYSKQKKLEVEK